jgi:pyrimidine operon attenuation protein/uracil phosphoribosyltransferase
LYFSTVTSRVLLNPAAFQLVIKRLAHQLIEVHDDFSNSVLIGLQPRGIYAARRLHKELTQLIQTPAIALGELDCTFYRDDFRKKTLHPNRTILDFTIEDKNVILIDDVLFTGRTIRSGLDALMDYGRPRDIELLVLIDRRLSRHVPIQAKYAGLTIDSIDSQVVKVEWQETDNCDGVTLLSN